MSRVYYNDSDPFCCAWLAELMRDGLIPRGEIDNRSIVDVRGSDLAGFEQCHFFAGIGGWAYALQLAGFRGGVWTGSCPCQPLAGVNIGALGFEDKRHLWPTWHNLIRECLPPTIFGEQVASGLGPEWLARVRIDLEASDYAVGAVNLAACGIAAPQKRERLWFVAVGDTEGQRRGEGVRTIAPASSCGETFGQPTSANPRISHAAGGAWADGEDATGRDGKRRRVKPGTLLLANGIPARVERCRGFGNAINPHAGAVFIRAFLETRSA